MRTAVVERRLPARSPQDTRLFERHASLRHAALPLSAVRLFADILRRATRAHTS